MRNIGICKLVCKIEIFFLKFLNFIYLVKIYKINCNFFVFVELYIIIKGNVIIIVM